MEKENFSSFRSSALSGKKALITGGGSGICFGIAEVLMKYGADVAIASRNKKKLEDAAIKLESRFAGRCLPIQMDVRNPEEVYRGVRTVIDTFERIDILINGAAGNFLCPFERLSPKGFKTVIEIDTIGAFNVSKAVFDLAFSKRLQSQSFRESSGIIINISASLHYSGTWLQSHAGAAKAALDALTKHLAVELGPKNIRVNAVTPGPILGTEGLSRLNPFREDSRSEDLSSGDGERPQEDMMKLFIPLQRLGTPEDIGHAVLFLCLPEANLITGANLVVDGGQCLSCANFTLLEPRMNAEWRKNSPIITAKL